MMEQTLTYEQAYKELSEISSEIENETISVDELATKVKRAMELINFCKAKLREVESEVNKSINPADDTDDNKKE